MTTNDQNRQQPTVVYHEQGEDPHASMIDGVGAALRVARVSGDPDALIAFTVSETPIVLLVTLDGHVIVDSALPSAETIEVLEQTITRLKNDKDD